MPTNQEWSVSYFEVVLDGFRKEVERLKQAMESFGNGRIAQWGMLVEALRRSEAAVDEARKEERAAAISDAIDWCERQQLGPDLARLLRAALAREGGKLNG